MVTKLHCFLVRKLMFAVKYCCEINRLLVCYNDFCTVKVNNYTRSKTPNFTEENGACCECLRCRRQQEVNGAASGGNNLVVV